MATDNDWHERLLVELHNSGHDSVSAFLARFPGEPYVDVAQRLAPWAAGMQVTRVHMQEARARGQLRTAAMDSLTRNLNWRLPRGWGTDSASESEAAGAAANTSSALVIDAQSPELAATMRAVFRSLKAAHPPLGWPPSGPDDPLICEAFDRGWPTPG